MMAMWDAPTRTETLQRVVRDHAVAGAMWTHADALKGEIDQRLVNEIAQLAVRNALQQYAAHISGDIASIESFHRMRADEMALRSPAQWIMDAVKSRTIPEVGTNSDNSAKKSEA